MKALIDGDIILYRSCWVCQKTHWTHKETGEFFDGKMKAKNWFKEICPEQEFNVEEWDQVEEIEPFKSVRYLIDNYVREIERETHSDSTELYLTEGKCFRDDIAVTKPYKAGRPPPPFHKDEAKAYMYKKHKATSKARLEADDLLGLNQTTETVIASVDKDLYMIPGKHYDIVTKEMIEMDLLSSDQWFMLQLMMGDRTDNIQGLPGVGKKTAEAVLMEFDGNHVGLVNRIKEMYNNAYEDGLAALIEHAQLVYILRAGDSPGNEQWRKLLLLEE
jgi:DNA polymerase-1